MGRGKRFAQGFMSFLAFLVFAVFVFALAALGALGPTLQEWVEIAWDTSLDFYQNNQSILDPAFIAIGTIGTALGTIFTLYKSWYYHEANLPVRLEELIAEVEHNTTLQRQALVPTLISPLTFDSLPVAPQPARSAWGFTWRRTDAERSINELDANRAHYEGAIPLLERRLQQFRIGLATDRLHQGLELARQAEQNLEPVSRDEQNKQSLALFQSALNANPLDFDALHLCARQLRILGRASDAKAKLELLRQKAAEAGDVVYAVRAQRLICEIEYAEAVNVTARTSVRNKLRAALEDISRVDPKPDFVHLETALVAEWLCRANVRLERYHRASQTLDLARGYAALVAEGNRKPIDARLNDLDKQIRTATADGEGEDGD